MLFRSSDAFVALPGGVGTLEELVEQLTWAQLGRHTKPVLLADINGFWKPLLVLFAHMRQFNFIRDGFDMLYKEGARTPKMMSVGLHMRLVGHPARAAGLERLLDHIGKHKDVWITRRVDIAKHWIATHPYPGKGLNE